MTRRFEIHLVSMPFGDVYRPSIALTQLKSVVSMAYGAQVDVKIHYLTFDFARALTAPLYTFISQDSASHIAGLGEWLFRQAAFPDAADQTQEYLTRYAQRVDPERSGMFEKTLLPLREQLPAMLDALIDKYQLHRADLVGLTSMFAQNLPSVALARRLKQRNPRAVTVLGGANCEGTMGIELVTHTDCLDFVFSGHSLVSFPQLVGCLLAGQEEACHRIDGVFSRRNSRSITEVTAPGDDIEWGKWKPERQLDGVVSMGRELDIKAPVPLDYDDYLDAYAQLPELASRKPILMFETSRGCWWGARAHCTFCGLNGGTMSFRAMEARQAIDLIEGLIARYSDRVYCFQSCDNILPIEYFDEVLDKLNTPEHVMLFYEVKANLTDQQVRKLARARVMVIQPGVESLVTATLKLMRKGTTSFLNIKLLLSCLRHGVVPEWNLLVGFPGESAEDYQIYRRELPKLFHLQPPMDVSPVRFDRFSPYFVGAREYGLKLEPYDYYSFCYPFPPRALMNLAYYYQDTAYESDYLDRMASSITELRQLIKRWKTRWAAQPAARPTLSLVPSGQGYAVRDARMGAARTIPLSAMEIEALAAMESPADEQHLRVTHDAAVSSLLAKGLVFRERARVMSLVPPMPEPSARPIETAVA